MSLVTFCVLIIFGPSVSLHIELLTKVVALQTQVTKACIIGFEDGALRAWSPPDFIPEQQCIDDIKDAFGGDVGGLAERGINVGCGVNPSVPGKMDDDGIYGNDGQRGNELYIRGFREFA